MIQHTVTFRTKHAKGSEAEMQFLQAFRELGSIEGVKKLKLMSQISAKNNFTFGASMYFESQEHYDFYNTHPEHLAFVENIWLKEVEEFLELDYVLLNEG